MPEFRVMKGIPMGKERVDASPEGIDAYLNEIHNIITAEGMLAGMVLIIDEAAQQSHPRLSHLGAIAQFAVLPPESNRPGGNN
jgi:hypothetical protein